MNCKYCHNGKYRTEVKIVGSQASWAKSAPDIYIIMTRDELHPTIVFKLPNSVEIAFTLIPMVCQMVIPKLCIPTNSRKIKH